MVEKYLRQSLVEFSLPEDTGNPYYVGNIAF